jgi:hypothetical protein
MKKCKTTAQFIQEAQSVHGHKYDYSQTEYVKAKFKVKIICPDHGLFEQCANGHLQGSGCLKCQGKGKNTDDFIRDALLVHGCKYDYSMAEYIKSNKKVKIICPDHGIFAQTPNGHLAGKGCTECGKLQRAKSRTKTTDDFIQSAQSVHGYRYDYSLTEYINARAKVKIICPDHGVFEQSPCEHMSYGCARCGGTAKKTTEEFIDESNIVHGGKYDYSLVEYYGNKEKVKIICPDHGVFEQTPKDHVKGRGCIKCAGVAQKTTEDFISEAVIVHGNRYDYSLVEYSSNKEKVKVICPEHGVFEQVANNHLRGQGCCKCAEYGFNFGKPGILYFIRFQKDFAEFWKIGITNSTIEDRFGKDALFVKERYEWQIDPGIYAYQIEQKVLKRFRHYRQPAMLFPLLLRGGDTECFTPNLPYKKAIAVIEREIKRLV